MPGFRCPRPLVGHHYFSKNIVIDKTAAREDRQPQAVQPEKLNNMKYLAIYVLALSVAVTIVSAQRGSGLLPQLERKFRIYLRPVCELQLRLTS